MAPTVLEGTSPSDLADYAYCPRSHWYRHHPPREAPAESSVRRAERGERYHLRTLAGTQRRAEHGVAYGWLVAAGIVLAVGGMLWLLF